MLAAAPLPARVVLCLGGIKVGLLLQSCVVAPLVALEFR